MVDAEVMRLLGASGVPSAAARLAAARRLAELWLKVAADEAHTMAHKPYFTTTVLVEGRWRLSRGLGEWFAIYDRSAAPGHPLRHATPAHLADFAARHGFRVVRVYKGVNKTQATVVPL